MTESVFRKRFVVLWVSFMVAAFVVSRGLLISGLNLETQRVIYQLLWLGTFIAAIVLYRRGSVADFAERERILAKANFGKIGVFSFFGSVFFLVMLAVGLGFGIWDARYESWKVWVGFFALAPINFGWMALTFLRIRNAHLRRMQGNRMKADSIRE